MLHSTLLHGVPLGSRSSGIIGDLARQASSATAATTRRASVALKVPARKDETGKQLQRHQDDAIVATTAAPAPSHSRRLSPLLSFPAALTFSGRVIVVDDILPLEQAPGDTGSSSTACGRHNGAATGDVRLRRLYLAESKAELNARNSHEIAATSDGDDGDAEMYSDRGPLRARFSTSQYERRNKYEISSRVFDSIYDFGDQLHQIDGHELVTLQKSSRHVARMSSGVVLIDVRCVKSATSAAAAAHGSSFSSDHCVSSSSPFCWLALSNVAPAIGRPHLGFTSADSALNLTHILRDFFESAAGLPCFRRLLNDNVRGSNRKHQGGIAYAMMYDQQDDTGRRSWSTTRSNRKGPSGL